MSTSEEEVNKFHDNDDVDGSRFAHHHTLGATGNQAAPGNHRHDGADSPALFGNMRNYYWSTGTPPYWYRQGVVTPGGLLHYNENPSGSIQNVVPADGEKILYTTPSSYRVYSGQTAFVKLQAEGRIRYPSTGGIAQFRCRATYQTNPPQEYPGGAAPAPPPSYPPSLSSNEIESIKFVEFSGTSVPTIFTIEWAIKFDINGYIWPCVTGELYTGDEFSFRKLTLKVTSEGSGDDSTEMLGGIVTKLREMGSDYGVRGIHNYYKYPEDPTP